MIAAQPPRPDWLCLGAWVSRGYGGSRFGIAGIRPVARGWEVLGRSSEWIPVYEHLADIITGFKGVVVARTDSITSCNQYYLQPPLDKDGKHVAGHWFDEHSLEYDPAHLGERVELHRTQEQPPG